MPNSLQSSAIASPASRRATNCSLSSITEHSFQGIAPSPFTGKSVTYVSGTVRYLCLRPLKVQTGLHKCPCLALVLGSYRQKSYRGPAAGNAGIGLSDNDVRVKVERMFCLSHRSGFRAGAVVAQHRTNRVRFLIYCPPPADRPVLQQFSDAGDD